MANDEFILRIVGPEVSPRSIEWGDLDHVIGGFRGAMASVARTNSVDSDSMFLGLSAVSQSGEDNGTYALVGSQDTLHAAERVISAISGSKSDLESLPEKAQGYLRQIWKTLFKNGWDACEFSGNGSAIGHAAIVREKELFPEIGTYRGDTVLHGEIIRTGGVGKKTANVRLLTGKLMTVQLRTKTLAQQLGERLYQIVGLTGEAIWSSADHSIITFRADHLTEYVDHDEKAKRRTFAQAVKALSQAAGNRWDGIDPDEFVREQRSD